MLINLQSDLLWEASVADAVQRQKRNRNLCLACLLWGWWGGGGSVWLKQACHWSGAQGQMPPSAMVRGGGQREMREEQEGQGRVT